MVMFMTEIIKSNEHKVAIEKSKVASIQIVTTKATRDSGYDDNYDQLDQQQQQVDQEETSFIEQSITIKDEMLPVTDDSIDFDKMNNSKDHSIGLETKSNEVSNLFNGNNQSCSNEVIEIVDHQKNTRIRTGSLAPKKYSFHTEEDDDLSSTTDENYLDDDDDNSANQDNNLEDKIRVTSGISFEEKTRVVKLAIEHPNWPINMLKEQSRYKKIRQRSQVERWKKQIQQGGSIRDRMNFVNNWMEQFDKHQLVTTDQELFTDSFNFCWELLKSKEYYLSERETDIFSKMSSNYGQDMYDAMMIIINKIMKFNEHKSKVDSIKIVTAEATCDSGYDDNCDQLDQQQKQQQDDKVNVNIDNSHDKMILEKRKIPVDEIHSKKMFKEEKKRVVKLATENPTWSLHMLREHSGCKNIDGRRQVERWKKQVQRGGTTREIMNRMEQFDKHQLLTTDQELFTDSFNFCWELLKSKEYYLSERETDIFSKMSLNYGQDIYDAMMIIINKIIKSNEHKVAVEESKVGSIKIVTAEATRDSGYDDNCDQLDQQQQQQQVDKVDSQEKMILKKRKSSVDEIHVKKMFKDDNNKNNYDDSNNAENIQITFTNENSIDKLHMVDLIEKEEKLFLEESITIKDEMLPVTDDSIDVDKTNNSDNQSIGLKRKSNEIFNFLKESNPLKDNNQRCSNKAIENVEHQKNTRTRTESLASEKTSFNTRENDELSSTTDEKKARVVKLATENPNWSLSWLRRRSGCEDIKQRSRVEEWKKQEEESFTKQNITIKDEMLPVTDDSMDVDEMNHSNDHSTGLEINSYEISNSFNSFKDNNQSCSNKSIENADHQRKTRISTGSLAPKKYKKTRVVRLAIENPTWSLDMLRRHSGCKIIKQRLQIEMWKKQIERGGTRRQKINLINNWDKKLFTKDNITTKDEIVSDDLIDVNNNQSLSNEGIEHQRNTRIRTGSLAPKKYSFHTEEDDDLSSTVSNLA
ncbi:uncharacterized protein LOC122860523 [Aphidius gifuensis]|uniref:uncharacterized protein LOC122860523 n=1 Tax=Aphidius gifuensis TaxID=684658 RepID=UPI001CDCA17A|nr:uncharacterized protein LOC122860523 [Aphidius gifuensis]